jgi:hypothetical protein
MLQASDQFEIVSEQDGMLFLRLLDTDVSLIYQQHPLLQETVTYQGIQLASPTDIGLMKLAAINSRGTRRDFVDIYCLRSIALWRIYWPWFHRSTQTGQSSWLFPCVR